MTAKYASSVSFSLLEPGSTYRQEGNQLNPTDEAIKDGAIALLFLILIVSFAIYFAAIRSNANMTAEVERNIGRASAFTLAFTAVAVIYCRAHFRLVK